MSRDPPGACVCGAGDGAYIEVGYEGRCEAVAGGGVGAGDGALRFGNI